MIDKPTLRRTMRARRAAAGARPIAVPPAFAARLSPGLVVASYAPIGGEADPAPLVRAARATGCAIALPHVVDHGTALRFLAWDGDGALIDGPFGLRNPAPHWDEVAPDVILTPLVAFDRRLNRLGQGAGHYDRAFTRFADAWRVGIAYGVQEVDALPADPWDVPLHAIATEKEWITP